MAEPVASRPTIFEHGIEELRDSWGWFLLTGVILLIGGVFAFYNTFGMALVSMLYLGILLLVAGLFQIVHAFMHLRWGGFFQNFLVGVLYTCVGFIILRNPAESVLAFTLVMSAFFVTAGLFRLVSALTLRYPSWGWGLVSGVVSTALGVLIFLQWPFSGLWAIGLFLGIEMLLNGVAFVMLSTALHSLPQEPRHAVA